MKHNSFTLVAFGVAALMLTAGCGKSLQQTIDKAKGNAAEEQRAEDQAVQDAQQDYLDEWKAFRSEAETQIAANIKSMDDLKAKAATADEKLRTKVTATLDDLSKKNQALKVKLDGYQDDGKVNWDAFKRDFSKDMEGLDKALKDMDTAAKK